MQEVIPITRDELKQYAKVSLPQTVRSISMQLNHADKRHVSYCFVWETDMGEQSIGTVAFDKTDEPRYYEKEGQIQTVTEPHWEQAIVMYAEANETPESFGAYGITMAGVAKVCNQLKLNSMKRVLIRTDKTNGAALGFFKKIGLTAYPEYMRAMDKKKSELVPTSGQVFDTTIEEMSAGLRYFARRIPNILSRAAQGGR